jgi:fructuronate reductase
LITANPDGGQFMRLTQSNLKNKEFWLKKGYSLPSFDRERVAEITKNEPVWLHFGAGNIFRAFIAAIAQDLLNDGEMDKGLIVAEGYDYEIIEKAYQPMDHLSLVVTLKSNGTIDKTIVGSVVESLIMKMASDDWNRLKEIFACKSLQMVSFTITEKGYNLADTQGNFFPIIISDFEAGPMAVSSYIGKLAALCYHRYLNGKLPISLVSMDNCSHNGTRLYNAVKEFAQQWESRGLVESGFTNYICNPAVVAFPWTMIDKITPRPDAKVKNMLSEDGFEDTESVITTLNTYIAPFVNTEETQYLVIEDSFPNGRPKLEKAGVMFTDKETVEKIEKMKVCTCLNPLHTALAVFGCLLGYQLICDEMKDPQLKKMVEIIGYKEGLPVVVNPGIMDPKEFIDTVINVRLTNPFMPDSPQRIATDTSQKLAIRFGETIKACLRNGMDITSIKIIPLVFAGFLRYLIGVDDGGNTFELSPDPMKESLQKQLAGIHLGDKGSFHEALAPIFSNEQIFGIDLYSAGLGELSEKYFAELITGTGAVRTTLKKYVGE